MYTQCSHCETVFQLTAETLRTAGGQVRCGRCGEIFNALARLAEDASAFSAPGESSDPRESALEMEARADEILRSPSPKRPAGPGPADDGEDLAAGDVEFARLQLIDNFKPSRNETPAPPRHLAPPVTAPPPPPRSPSPKTKTAPPPSAPASGKRATRDAAPAHAPAPSPSPSPAPAAAPTATAARAPASSSSYSSSSENDARATRAGAAPADDGALEFTLPPGELDRVFIDPSAARARLAGLAGPDAVASRARPADESGESGVERVSGLDVAEHVRRDVLAGLRQRQTDLLSAPAQPVARLAWGGAAAVLALALLAQILHENRAWLAAHGPLRGPLQSVYAALGVKVQPPVNLSAYQLRQWGVTGDPNAAGTLRVRASILNTSAQLQPYPLLRVTLANRFGTHVGARDFEPSEYIGRPIARLMTPGERADATLDIQDPGKDAEGFEIDVCLRGADQSITCAADAAAQAGGPQADGPQAGASRADAPELDAPEAGEPRADAARTGAARSGVPRAGVPRTKP